jgi:hypothetical protein
MLRNPVISDRAKFIDAERMLSEDGRHPHNGGD